ncbi:MAG: CYTH domain-containing protein [Candidatus Kapaibacterium sp.]
MGKEIERKFLVNPKLWESAEKPAGVFYRQGYILAEPGKTVRVRIAGNAGFLTIKGAAEGISRDEFEYEIPLKDAEEMLDKLCGSEVVKKRYKVFYGGKLWEVDVFEGGNQGLILAEIELKSEDELFDVPEWIDKEVTGDLRYYNSYLSMYPFKGWG